MARAVSRTTTVQTVGVRALSTMAPGKPEPSLIKSKTENVLSRTPSPFELGKHRSNALDLVNQQPIIEVDGDIAICDGGGGALGHPVEYIKVGHRNGEPKACVYCGLKYKKRGD
eukprot:CAMPEP_0195269506 /NCGR_PEP_ID=MMETSP0706-20130129/13808_1 /TAXON_ID=33640 /ORGANISM="Asterionellopsis glacialis, Strain CCMP134" /LENGTH=113 /DNA_ID=CAMNT_0040324625 /DNA_START=252 /DNA_END=593 /DNA_ORIENTATION=-